MPDPIDYISPLGRFADAGQLMQAMQLGDAQIETERAQQQAYRAQGQAQQQKTVRQAAYQQAVTQVLLNPTDKAGYRRLMVEFPEFAEPIKAAHDSLDTDQQRVDLAQATDVAALALGGNYKGSADALRLRIDADKAAGKADPQDEALLAELESDDPVRQKAAAGLAAAHVAAIGGVDHFSGILDSLKPKEKAADIRNVGAGDDVISVDPETGKASTIYRSPYLKGPNGQLYEREGGDPASGGGAADGNFETFHSRFLGPIEGGYAASDGRSGAPVNFGVNQRANPDVDVKNLTEPQAKAILRERYWKASGADKLPAGLAEVHGDTAINAGVGKAKELLRQSRGDVGKYLDLREQYYRKLGGKELPAWLDRNAKLRAYVSGGESASTGALRPLFPEKPEDPKPAKMTPAEVAAEGLDPNTVYYRDANGVPQAVSGQTQKDTGQLKPVPVTATKQILANRGTVREIDRAIELLQKRPQSIGFGTGALGDWFTQRNDPDGTPVRAAVGKIGGKIIHDISGAAVTMSEAPRFQPYVPVITDTADTALKKLRQLRQLAVDETTDLESAWGPDNGYRGVKLGGGASAPASAKPMTGGFRILRVRPK